MQRFGGALLAVMVVTCILLQGSTTSAQATASGKLKVYAKVVSQHSVTVDKDGNILEVISNTTEDVPPTFYNETISRENKIPGNNNLLLQYQRIVQPGQSRVGILYQRYGPLSLKSTGLFTTLIDARATTRSTITLR